MRLRRIDRYLLSRTFGPMAAVLVSTMLVFLLERLLRSFHLLAQTRDGAGYLVGLMVNLAPHYLGLVLPIGFFIALIVVINRLNRDSEIDAMLASGMSLGRIAAPFLALGLAMMLLSVALYGFIQPYSRYAYRAVLHAAENAGWNGELKPRAILSPGRNFQITADEVDPAGQRLERVFIRRLAPSGHEDVLTAASAEIRRNNDGRSVTLELRDGQQVRVTTRGGAHLLTFSSLSLRLPLAPSARLLRSRGRGQESELTLIELARLGYGREAPALPRQALLAELYSRLARAVALPLMPLFAVPLGLSAKRSESGPAFAIAGLLLFAFQTSLVFGQGLAESGAVLAAPAIGGPFVLFAAACALTFATSRKTPGENPVNWIAERLSDVMQALSERRSPSGTPASSPRTGSAPAKPLARPTPEATGVQGGSATRPRALEAVD